MTKARYFDDRLAAWCGGVLLTVLLVGCGARQPVAAPVNTDKAMLALKTVLETWKSGETPEACQKQSPKIVVQDFAWGAGSKLRDFEILGPGEAKDANLVCQVKLMLADPSKGETQQTVSYVVGTDPVLTVFRNMMP